MLDKLQAVEQRFSEVNTLLSDPSIISDREKYRSLTQERSQLEPLVATFQAWRRAGEEAEATLGILEESSDSELREMANQDLAVQKALQQKLEQELLILLMPKDPNDEKNVLLEIRAGTGGDEAALFAEELFSAYVRYAESRRWRVEMLSGSESSVGGLKEVVALIEGQGVFSVLKYESGVHRVQRVPKTETQGRIHTSTVTVAILPEAEEVDVEVNDKDLRIDVFRSSGPGGQSVNTTDSAVRITHIPSGIVVSCQDEKSQHKNKAKALKVLRARLFDAKQAEQNAQRQGDRRSQIGTGERSERIRTYNFPQGRVTDHRIGLTLYQIDSIMGGKLDSVIDPLIAHYRAEALAEQNQ